MVKKWLYAVGLIFILVTSTNAQAADRIAVVNISSIFQQSPQRALVAKQLEQEFKIRVTELQYLEQDLQTQIERLQRNSSVMNANERSALERSLLVQRETFSNKAQAFEQDNHRRQNEERNKIILSIQDVVKKIASKKGYDVVIDVNAVAYASNTKDITADVLKQVL
ncbi:Outer membrane protein H precursor [Candidatus Palibaumannia cicadellinicola]|uniref:Outer membrane protein H n=1 Tax=Candidatus Palibaumannia cicadellinicola TaxID=186490 RepID=A0A088MYS3_9GAMM|nr:molecular chaperone Skp [Candidatus Baumannia cicadellinicola]AIN47457.1 Outer membrane protein H precursor [Candidatus Baumannia cicadellinicola]